MDIGLAIARMRSERKMTLITLFELTNISQSTLSRIESGETKKLDIASAIAIAGALKVTIGELIERAEKCDTEETRKLREKIKLRKRMTKELRANLYKRNK